MMPQVPSKRYDLFIQFFEKKVDEAQKQIEELRKFEPLYNVAREVLEKHDISNAVKIQNVGSYLSVNIIAGEEDHYKDFVPIVKDICKALIRLKLREAEISYNITKENVWTWCWQMSTKLGLILTIRITFPYEGNKYLKIVTKEVMIKSYEWKHVWLEKE